MSDRGRELFAKFAPFVPVLDQGSRPNIHNVVLEKQIAASEGKWQAGISVKGIRHHLGLFSSVDEASVAYEAAARERFGEFYRQPQER